MTARPAPPRRIPPDVLAAIVAQAAADGTHGRLEDWRTVCQGACGQWVDAIVYVDEQGKRYCRKCAPPDAAAGKG